MLADKAYGAGVNRRLLRERGIKAVIPEKSDQITARKHKGSAGGRPPAFDADAHEDRNVVERSFALVKQWGTSAPGSLNAAPGTSSEVPGITPISTE